MGNGLDECLYSMNTFKNELMQNCVKQDGYVYKHWLHAHVTV